MFDSQDSSPLTKDSVAAHYQLQTTPTMKPFSRVRSRLFSRALAKAISLDTPSKSKQASTTRNDKTLPFNTLAVRSICATSPKASDMNELIFAGSKLSRVLFVRNIPTSVSRQILVQFINRKLQRLKMCDAGHNAVVSCRMYKKFAFLECATVEDADKVRLLHNISILGTKLNISFASKYLEFASENTFRLSSLSLVHKMNDNQHKSRLRSNDKPTRIVKLKNLLSFEDLETDDSYFEASEEVKDQCAQYGNLRNIFIPRSGIDATKIYLEYETKEDAQCAVDALTNQTFDDRSVNAEFVEEESYYDSFS